MIPDLNIRIWIVFRLQYNRVQSEATLEVICVGFLVCDSWHKFLYVYVSYMLLYTWSCCFDSLFELLYMQI